MFWITEIVANVTSNRKHGEPLPVWEYWVIVGLIFLLVVVGGIVAGLTIGLMSLDNTNLSILRASGTPKEKKYAERIAPIRKNSHLLLVTLLLVNTVVNETLPILFDAIHFTGWKAVFSSTVLIVIFGEILPQAICSRYGLQIGAFFAWPVRILIFFLWLVSYPVAALLDWMLGHKGGVVYRHAGLKELVSLHGEDQEGPLSSDEVSVLRAVLDLRSKTVKDVMTPLKDVYMLEISQRLDKNTASSVSSIYIDCESRSFPSSHLYWHTSAYHWCSID
jgi:metal transporter CNNM